MAADIYRWYFSNFEKYVDITFSSKHWFNAGKHLLTNKCFPANIVGNVCLRISAKWCGTSVTSSAKEFTDKFVFLVKLIRNIDKQSETFEKANICKGEHLHGAIRAPLSSNTTHHILFIINIFYDGDWQNPTSQNGEASLKRRICLYLYRDWPI